MKSLELQFDVYGKLSLVNNNFAIRKKDKSYLVNEMKKILDRTPAYSGLKLIIKNQNGQYFGKLSLYSSGMEVNVSTYRKAIPILFDDLAYKLNDQLANWLKNRFILPQQHSFNRSIA